MKDNCRRCIYYYDGDKTCQLKKVSTGGEGYVTIFDRLFCLPIRSGWWHVIRIGTYKGLLSLYTTNVIWNGVTGEIIAKFPCYSKPTVLGSAKDRDEAIAVAKEKLGGAFKEVGAKW